MLMLFDPWKGLTKKREKIMKYHVIAAAAISSLAPSLLRAAPENLFEGAYFDSSLGSGIFPWAPFPSGRKTVEYSNNNGGLVLYASQEETAKPSMDGGITMYGNPVNIVLGTDNDPGGNYDRGSFQVWKSSKWQTTSLTDKPLLELNSATGTTIFDSTDVSVVNGSLSVGGSPVLTEGTGGSFVQGLGYLKTADFDSTLAAATPPAGGSWASSYVRRGNTGTGTGWMTAGDAQATGANAIASGSSTTLAAGASSIAIGSGVVVSGSSSLAQGLNLEVSGNYSLARGWNSKAMGNFSTAVGRNVEAHGTYSGAAGYYTKAESFGETVLGAYNNLDTSPSGDVWVNLDTLFRVGNGDAGSRSDAVRVNKVGTTTITNRAWKGYVANSESPLYVPADPQWGGSEALVVEGHTRMKGIVLIEQPQGDISMGIYE